MRKVPIYSSDYTAYPGASAQTIYIQLCYSFILLYRHTYLHTELHYVLYLCFSARVMVGLASPPLEAGAWLAVGRRPLGRRLPPREPLRVRPRRFLYSCIHNTALALRNLTHICQIGLSSRDIQKTLYSIPRRVV